MKRILVLSTVFVMLFIVGVPESIAGDQSALESRLAYLSDIPEISSVKLVRNNVYIGFNKRTLDMGTIVRGAAAFGNRAYGARVHVWACVFNANEPNPEKWRYYCSATGQNGKVKKSDCR